MQTKPYFAVIFSSRRTELDPAGYARVAARMDELARAQPGFLGVESARDSEGFGITVSYWESAEAIQAWKRQAEHLAAQAGGREKWYAAFTTRVCQVEREYSFTAPAKPESAKAIRAPRETARLHIRALGDADPGPVLDYFVRNRAHLAPTDPPHPTGFHTLPFWVEKVQAARRERAAGTAYRFVLATKAAPARIIGTANLTQVARGPFQAAYLGYGIDHAHEGQGLMREALGELLRHAFADLNLHRIMANHLPTNSRSAKLLEKLGFQVEGLAKSYLYIDGEWRDHVLTSLTNANW